MYVVSEWARDLRHIERPEVGVTVGAPIGALKVRMATVRADDRPLMGFERSQTLARFPAIDDAATSLLGEATDVADQLEDDDEPADGDEVTFDLDTQNGSGAERLGI